MVKMNQQSLAIGLFAIMAAAAIGSSSFGSVYADGDSDKVKVDCDDVAMALTTLFLAVEDLDDDGRDTLDDELQEGELIDSSEDVEDLADNFQNVKDKVDDKCGDFDFSFNFVDFEDWNLS
jgi:hypothetical protein